MSGSAAEPGADEGQDAAESTAAEESQDTGGAESPEPAAADADEGSEEEPSRISVTLLQLGTGEEPIELDAGSTVGDLLEEAGLSLKDGEVLVNSRHASLDDELPEGATVVFASNIEGGCR
jgi:sulfur carrier protein ThiS